MPPLQIKNLSSHKDAPVDEMMRLVSVQIFHYDNRWAGAWHVVRDLQLQGFYLALVDALPEAPGALGYHDVDSEGRPYSKVAVDPSLKNGSDWLTGPYSVVSIVGHEALETVGDPLCNRWIDIDQHTQTAQEMCDAVEATGYRHDGADLTNFLLPSWFNPFGKAPFDWVGQLSAPFTMTHGGYMLINSGGRVTQQRDERMPEWRQQVVRTRASLRGVIA